MQRLDAMQRYAQTRACRRAFLLRYFGDPDARASCTACDRCGASRGEVPEQVSARRPARRTRPRSP
jgi:ATP-dependent DNA helicase RecQ